MSRCPRCGGYVITVARRAWCVRRYDDGGCGSDFYLRGASWHRTAIPAASR